MVTFLSRWPGGGLLLVITYLVTACHGQSMPHHSVLAERYFSGAALPAALACQHDDAAALAQELAAHHARPDAVGVQGMTLIFLAMSNRSNQALRTLLEHGANPNLRVEFGLDRDHMQPIGLAAGAEDIEPLRLLLAHGGDPNSQYHEHPAIFEAAIPERDDHLRLLVEHGADVNATEEDGTPLVASLALLARYDQVAYLIEHGADIHQTDAVGGTVAYWLQERGFAYESDYVGYPAMVKVKHLLETRGVRFPVPDPYIAQRAQLRAENVLRRQWETTPEGRHWRAAIGEVERAREQLLPGLNADQLRNLEEQAEPIFQAWRKTQPDWVPIVHQFEKGYPYLPSVAEDAAAAAQDRLQAETDSARWTEQARTIH